MNCFKKLTLIEFLVLIGIIIIIYNIILNYIKPNLINTNVQILKEETLYHQTGKRLQYIKLNIEGHDYFFIQEKFSKNINPIHCIDCKKCQEKFK